MKVDFTKLVVRDIEDNELPITDEKGNDLWPVYKFILNKLYYMFKDIELRDKIKSAYKWEVIDLSKDEVTKIEDALNSEHVPLSPLLVGETLDFISNSKK